MPKHRRRETTVKLRGEVGAEVKERLKTEPQIPKEYRDLWLYLVKRVQTNYHHHNPIDCSIEKLPGATGPKPKLYLKTPRELDEFQAFIDKNLKRGFIQPARPQIAASVLYQEGWIISMWIIEG